MTTNKNQQLKELANHLDAMIAERNRRAEEYLKIREKKDAENRWKLESLPLNEGDKWLWDQNTDEKSTPDAPNTTTEEVAEKMGTRVWKLEATVSKHDWEVSSNKTLVSILLVGIVISIAWLVIESFWILPEYKEEYIRAASQQTIEIEILKKDDEKLKSDNDDLKTEVKYLRERFDHYIDISKPQSK